MLIQNLRPVGADRFFASHQNKFLYLSTQDALTLCHKSYGFHTSSLLSFLARAVFVSWLWISAGNQLKISWKLVEKSAEFFFNISWQFTPLAFWKGFIILSYLNSFAMNFSNDIFWSFYWSFYQRICTFYQMKWKTELFSRSACFSKKIPFCVQKKVLVCVWSNEIVNIRKSFCLVTNLFKIKHPKYFIRRKWTCFWRSTV